MNRFLLDGVLDESLAYKLSDITSILDNSRDFDSSWPIVEVETLIVSKLEELFLIESSVIG